MTETIGERVRRLRRERDFSQGDLAEEGITTAHISRIESGARTPSMRALRKLASKLGVSTEYLETGSEWTTTDHLLEDVTARLTVNAPLGAQVTFQIDAIDPYNVGITWTRWYGDPPDSYVEAGLSGGESSERQVCADSLTEALRAVLAYEEEADECDARAVEMYQHTIEAKKNLGDGRPVVANSH